MVYWDMNLVSQMESSNGLMAALNILGYVESNTFFKDQIRTHHNNTVYCMSVSVTVYPLIRATCSLL